MENIPLPLRSFIAQLIVLGVCLVAINGAVRYLARNTDARKVIREIEQSDGATDLFVGNSVVRQAFRTAAFEAAMPACKAINIAVHGITPVEEDLLLRKAMPLKPARIFVGFFETALTDPPQGGWEALSDRRAVSYYLYPEIASEFYFPHDALAAIEMRVIGVTPMLCERHRIWLVVERWRATFARIGLPPDDDSTPFHRLPPAAWQIARGAECQRAFQEAIDRKTALSAPILDMIALAKSAGAQIFIVEAPVSSLHRRLVFGTPIGRAYRAYLAQQVAAHGGVYIDSMDWVDDESFGDWIHVDRAGGAEFSQRLATVVAAPATER